MNFKTFVLEKNIINIEKKLNHKNKVIYSYFNM